MLPPKPEKCESCQSLKKEVKRLQRQYQKFELLAARSILAGSVDILRDEWPKHLKEDLEKEMFYLDIPF